MNKAEVKHLVEQERAAALARQSARTACEIQQTVVDEASKELEAKRANYSRCIDAHLNAEQAVDVALREYAPEVAEPCQA